MPRAPKVIIDFSGMSETDFPVEVKKTNVSIITNHSTFPDLPVEISIQDNLVGEYYTIINSPYYEGQAAELAKKRSDIQKNITKNGNYFNTLANGDLTILEKTGYPISKTPEKQGILGKTVLALTVSDVSGELSYNITGAIEKGITFAIFFTLADNAETNPFKWQFLYCPKRKGTIKALISQRYYKFVSVAMGTDPTLVFSDVVIKSAV